MATPDLPPPSSEETRRLNAIGMAAARRYLSAKLHASGVKRLREIPQPARNAFLTMLEEEMNSDNATD